MRTCPSCQFLVDDGATTCQVCGAEIQPAATQAAPPGWSPGPPQPQPRTTGRRTLAIVLGVVGAIAGLIAGTVLVGTLVGDSPDAGQFDRFDLVDNDALAELEPGELGEWQVFENTDPGFRVELPGSAVVDSLPVAGAAADLDATIAAVGSGDQAYLAMWSKTVGLPDLDAAVVGGAANAGGTIVRSDPMQLAGMEARRATVDAAQLTIKMVVASDATTFYQLIVVASPSRESTADDDLDRMVNSFALVP